MGKADDDLPDSLAIPGSGSTQSADELLAALASSEVDRLLAEAELERPIKSAASSFTQPMNLGMPPEPDLALITRAGDAALEHEPAGAEALARVDAETARQLDKLFDELQPGGGGPAQNDEATPTPRVATAFDEPAGDPNLTAQLSDLFTQLTGRDEVAGAVFEDPDEQTGDAERRVLASELLEAAGPLTRVASDDADRGEELAGVPWYLKPLEWLNAPLASCSDRMREVLGKVAIVTLVNALAVLLYVVLVRRR